MTDGHAIPFTRDELSLLGDMVDDAIREFPGYSDSTCRGILAKVEEATARQLTGGETMADDYAARRELEDREHTARRKVIDAYLSTESAGLAWAIIDAEGYRAIAELRRVDKVLREHGFCGPLGAAGVEDVFTQMGAVQFHEEEIPVLLIMTRNFMAAAGQLGITLAEDSEQIARSIIDRLEAAGGTDPG